MRVLLVELFLEDILNMDFAHFVDKQLKKILLEMRKEFADYVLVKVGLGSNFLSDKFMR
jgi:hypothetical protein